MRERGILMTAQNVRWILAGTKTQTRRIVKPQPDSEWWPVGGLRFMREGATTAVRETMSLKCPYGVPGDRLGVREAWRFEGTDMMRHGRAHCTQDGVIRYLADDTRRTINTDWRNVETWMKRRPQNRPGIHMPRWASRITLEITDVRVERLQEISEADAMAEGVNPAESVEFDGGHLLVTPAHRRSYARLWESINGPGSWDANPWVWALTFRRIGDA